MRGNMALNLDSLKGQPEPTVISDPFWAVFIKQLILKLTKTVLSAHSILRTSRHEWSWEIEENRQRKPKIRVTERSINSGSYSNWNLGPAHTLTDWQCTDSAGKGALLRPKKTISPVSPHKRDTVMGRIVNCKISPLPSCILGDTMKMQE